MATSNEPRRRMPASERREQLLAAAREVFATRGYHRASIDEIAGAAGVSKALIYEHFASKRDLHGALLEATVAELLGRLAWAAGADEPGAVRLRAGIDAFLAFVEERREAWQLLFRDSADPEVADLVARMEAAATRAIAALIATDPGSRADAGDPALGAIAAQLVGAMQGLANWWHEHRSVPRAELVDRAMDFAWVGLERLAAGERAPR